MLEAARASPFTLPETEARKSQVWLVAFGERGLDFELLVWPTQAAVKRPARMHAAYTWLIAYALDAARIEVPFPQTDVRFRSLFSREGEDAIRALGLEERRGAILPAAQPKQAGLGADVSMNDAAQRASHAVPGSRR